MNNPTGKNWSQVLTYLQKTSAEVLKIDANIFRITITMGAKLSTEFKNSHRKSVITMYYVDTSIKYTFHGALEIYPSMNHAGTA